MKLLSHVKDDPIHSISFLWYICQELDAQDILKGFECGTLHMGIILSLIQYSRKEHSALCSSDRASWQASYKTTK
jgi:hypothetical protein